MADLLHVLSWLHMMKISNKVIFISIIHLNINYFQIKWIFQFFHDTIRLYCLFFDVCKWTSQTLLEYHPFSYLKLILVRCTFFVWFNAEKKISDKFKKLAQYNNHFFLLCIMLNCCLFIFEPTYVEIILSLVNEIEKLGLYSFFQWRIYRRDISLSISIIYFLCNLFIVQIHI